MAHVRDVLAALESFAPARYAFEFDKVGLQVGDPNAEIQRAAVSLDRSLGAVAYAKENGCQLLLAHHPLIFTPLASVDTRSHVGRTVVEMVRHGISFIAAHTNWDSARGGVNDELARLFSLRNVAEFGTAGEVERLKLVFFCPADDADAVIDAVAAEGAGIIGKYSRCAFSNPGVGTFEAGAGAHPTKGRPGDRSSVDEMRVEMVLLPARQKAVIRALKRAHPYEEPAYDLLTCVPRGEQPSGRVGELEHALTLAELAQRADEVLSVMSWAWGDPSKKIRKVAVVGGAADNEWVNAQRAGADVLLTGEVKQHVALEAVESGFALIAAGHFQTEHPGADALCRRMATELPEIDWRLFTPDPGFHGRPI